MSTNPATTEHTVDTSVALHIQGCQNGEWVSVRWQGERGEDLSVCESEEQAKERLAMLIADLQAPEVVAKGGHAWDGLRIARIKKTVTTDVDVVACEMAVPNPGLDLVMRRRPTGHPGA